MIDQQVTSQVQPEHAAPSSGSIRRSVIGGKTSEVVIGAFPAEQEWLLMFFSNCNLDLKSISNVAPNVASNYS